MTIVSTLGRASRLVGGSLFGGFWEGAKIPHVWVAIGAAALAGHVTGHELASRGVRLLHSDIATLRNVIRERNVVVAQLRDQIAAIPPPAQVALVSQPVAPPLPPPATPRRPMVRPVAKTVQAPASTGLALPWPFN